MTQLFIIKPDNTIELREHSDEPISLEELTEIVGEDNVTASHAMWRRTALISAKDGKQFILPKNLMATDCLRSDVFTTLYGTVLWAEHKKGEFYGFRPTKAKILKDILEEAASL